MILKETTFYSLKFHWKIDKNWIPFFFVRLQQVNKFITLGMTSLMKQNRKIFWPLTSFKLFVKNLISLCRSSLQTQLFPERPLITTHGFLQRIQFQKSTKNRKSPTFGNSKVFMNNFRLMLINIYSKWQQGNKQRKYNIWGTQSIRVTKA